LLIAAIGGINPFRRCYMLARLQPVTQAVRSMRYSMAALCTLMWVIATAPAAEAPAPLVAVRCGHLLDTQAGVLLGETTVVTDGPRFHDVIAGDRRHLQAR
jgi:hypothetical protein